VARESTIKSESLRSLYHVCRTCRRYRGGLLCNVIVIMLVLVGVFYRAWFVYLLRLLESISILFASLNRCLAPCFDVRKHANSNHLGLPEMQGRTHSTCKLAFGFRKT